MSRSGHSWRHGVGAAGLAGLVAIGTAACGGGSASARHAGQGAALTGTAQQIVLASATRTADASTARVKLAISVSGTPSVGGLTSTPSAGGTQGPLSLSINASGAFDFADKSGTLTLDLPGSLGAGQQPVQIRLVGPTLYLDAPGLSSADGGKPWVSLDLASYLKKEGQSGGALGDLSTGDPTQILGLLQQVSGDMTSVGPATIDGVATTHYHGTIDLAKAAPSSPTGTSLVSPAELQQLEQAFGLSSLPVDVWVDGQGRARQLQLQVSVLGLTVSVTLNLGDFGAPVSVTAPPADQTADGSGLLDNGQLGSLFQ